MGGASVREASNIADLWDTWDAWAAAVGCQRSAICGVGSGGLSVTPAIFQTHRDPGLSARQQPTLKVALCVGAEGAGISGIVGPLGRPHMLRVDAHEVRSADHQWHAVSQSITQSIKRCFTS